MPTPSPAQGYDFFLAGGLMLPFVDHDHRKMLNLKLVFQFAFISLFLVLFFIGLFEALKTTSATRTSVIYTAIPLLSVVITFIGLKTVTPIFQLVGFILGGVGAIWVLIAFTHDELSLFNWYVGDSIFVLACCCLAIHVMLIKKWTSSVPPIQSAFYILVMGSIIMLPLLLVYGDLTNVAWQQIAFWKILLYLTVFTTMATFFLQQHLLHTVGPNRLLAYTYLIPSLVVIPQGLTVISELNSGLPGIVLTLLALYLISKKRAQSATVNL